MSFEPELSYSDDPCPEPVELPSRVPISGGGVYYGFHNPYLLVYLPISLGTASQRAQALLECCPCHFLLS